jgi:hypothetical protein
MSLPDSFDEDLEDGDSGDSSSPRNAIEDPTCLEYPYEEGRLVPWGSVRYLGGIVLELPNGHDILVPWDIAKKWRVSGAPSRFGAADDPTDFPPACVRLAHQMRTPGHGRARRR